MPPTLSAENKKTKDRPVYAQEEAETPYPRDRYVAVQMAEVAIPETLFADIPRLIAELRPPPICFVSVMRSAVLRPLTLTAEVRLDEGKASVRQHKTGWWLESDGFASIWGMSVNRSAHNDELRRRNMKILMVLTSHDQLGNTGRKTGFWLEEFAAPYFVFRDADVQLTLTSPKGGQPPVDPKSDLPENQTPAMARFKQDQAAQKALSQTVRLSNVKAEDYDTVFYVGGHGPMWDLAESADSIALIESFYNSGKPVALVCHSPGVLHRVTYKGAPIVKGKRVTGFTNDEEEAVHLTNVVPFLVEDELKRLGGIFEKVPNWQPFSIVDGRLITGQNPASSTGAAQALLNLVTAEKAA